MSICFAGTSFLLRGDPPGHPRPSTSRLDKVRGAVDYSDSDERVILQTLFATTVSNSLYYSQFPGLGGTCSRKIDFDDARVIAEYGPGEGVHTREIVRRMRPDAELLVFEARPRFLEGLGTAICRRFPRSRY